ncbi:ABC transporter permease [Nocardioides marmoribigeumensis]|uniref:Peptide/nickel transport system permease protein n=1 Tax=Nocardioides marmoribigeumensis TaxID=433649 RepID=A0ABU2BV62_9ACTN|nr:ABC transporter permease [Nocardioides marmoribigeumensis]MDR7362525.1 peptide/nickel transport system permease protein [Nocardioides marmoribigeumensis]
MSIPLGESVEVEPTGAALGEGVASTSGRPPRRSGWETGRRALRLGRTRVGLGIWLTLVTLAVLGPWLAPYSATEFVGIPSTSSAAHTLLGTDNLGRDVLSRFLSGGRSVIALSLVAALIGVGTGTLVGVVAAYFRGVRDDVLMRAADVLMAFPQIIFVLVLLAGFGSKLWLLVLAVGITHAPHTARVVRGAAMDVVERDFVKAAEAIGVPRRTVVLKEIIPNVSSPILVELGLRMTYSIALIAGLSFLGFGLQPPSADWGLMINENRLAIEQQPWAVLLPVLAIGLLTVASNLVADGIARASIGIDRSNG